MQTDRRAAEGLSCVITACADSLTFNGTPSVRHKFSTFTQRALKSAYPPSRIGKSGGIENISPITLKHNHYEEIWIYKTQTFF